MPTTPLHAQCCPTASPATVDEPEVRGHLAHRIARHRLHQAKRRDDFTVTAITFGPKHRFDLGALDFFPHSLANDGDCSITVEYHFATSPNRPRREVFNIRTQALARPLWDVLNEAANA